MATQVLITTNDSYFGEEGFLRADCRTLLTAVLGEDADLYITIRKDSESTVGILVNVDATVSPEVPAELERSLIWGARLHNVSCKFEFTELAEGASGNKDAVQGAEKAITQGLQGHVNRFAGGWY